MTTTFKNNSFPSIIRLLNINTQSSPKTNLSDDLLWTLFRLHYLIVCSITVWLLSTTDKLLYIYLCGCVNVTKAAARKNVVVPFLVCMISKHLNRSRFPEFPPLNFPNSVFSNKSQNVKVFWCRDHFSTMQHILNFKKACSIP